MKSILISIKPKYVAKILNGEKTIEIRKTMPKCELPIDVFIYCTKGKGSLVYHRYKQSGEYLVKKETLGFNLCGKVVAKFTLKKIDDIGKYAYAFKDDFFYETLKNACLTVEDLTKYANVTRDKFERKGMKLYAWHISDLVIFDKPRELGDFMKPNWGNGLEKALEKARKEDDKIKERIYYGTAFEDEIANCEKLTLEGFELAGRITKAPQSWCYVEEED